MREAAKGRRITGARKTTVCCDLRALGHLGGGYRVDRAGFWELNSGMAVLHPRLGLFNHSKPDKALNLV